jgi:hypothetical protein
MDADSISEKMQICPRFFAVTERWLHAEATKSSFSLSYLRLSASICGSNCIVPVKACLHAAPTRLTTFSLSALLGQRLVA